MIEVLIEFIRTQPAWGLIAVFVGAFLEYLLPPLPADSVVLAGSLLVVAEVSSMMEVVSEAMAGGFLGAAAVYGLGRMLARPDGRMRGERWIARIFGKDSIPKFVVLFRRYGYRLLLVNRALPAVRGVTFLAAGAVRLHFGWTMVAGSISQLVWTVLIVGVGVSVGGQWENIQQVFAVYEKAVYGVAVVAMVLIASIWWIRRKRGGSE